jgi:UTP:GlnB (protein PII) uridylyltransferase
VAVYVKDQEDLFARICAYFERHGFSIWDARIHTTRHGYALDTFQISGSNLVDEGGSYRDIIQLVEFELTSALTNADPLPHPSMGRFPGNPALSRYNPGYIWCQMIAVDITHSHFLQVTVLACSTQSLGY